MQRYLLADWNIFGGKLRAAARGVAWRVGTSGRVVVGIDLSAPAVDCATRKIYLSRCYNIGMKEAKPIVLYNLVFVLDVTVSQWFFI